MMFVLCPRKCWASAVMFVLCPRKCWGLCCDVCVVSQEVSGPLKEEEEKRLRNMSLQEKWRIIFNKVHHFLSSQYTLNRGFDILVFRSLLMS